MSFWIPVILLIIAAMGVLASAARLVGRNAPDSRAATLAIYKDQLAEITRDVDRGLLSASEAEGQKAEVGRRMLQLAREQEGAASASARPVPAALVLLVPLIAVPVYYYLGKPALPDVPRAERLAAAQNTGDLEALVARVEDHLAEKPDDATGWNLLIPNYLNMGRYGDAARAIGRVIEISGPTADLYAAQSEALTFENRGMMTAASIAAAQEALKLDPKLPKARYYAALGLAQNGKTAEAKAAFEAFLADSPPDAPWRETVQRELAKLAPGGAGAASAPQISPDQMNNAATMTPEEQANMIRGMVDGLEQKLAANPADAQGWLRLIRARTVMNEKDKAIAALAKAREALKADQAALAALDQLAKELALQ